MNVKQLKTALPLLLDLGITPLIEGHAGIGKSQIVRGLADEGHHVLTLHLSQAADVGDLIGLMDVANSDDFCTFKLPKKMHDLITFCQENPDKLGIIFFDELNRATKDLLQASFQLILERELNGQKLPANLRCVAAQNPANEEYDVLNFGDFAFSDRFCHLAFNPSFKEWLEYAKSQKLNSTMISFYEKHPELLSSKRSEIVLDVKPTNRSSVMAMSVFDRKEEIDNDTLFEILRGLVGLEVTSSLMDFAKNHRETLTVKEVISDFPKVEPLIKQYGSIENNRHDILTNLTNKMVEHFKDKVDSEKKITKKESESLVAFMYALPQDLFLAFFRDFNKAVFFRDTKEQTEVVQAAFPFLQPEHKEAKKMEEYVKEVMGKENENTEQ